MSRQILTQEHALEMLNRKYFMSSYRGKFQVYREERHRLTRRIELIPMSARDFADAHSHLAVVEEGDVVAAGRWWIQHHAARRYEAIIFDPNPDAVKSQLAHPEIYNTFRGFETQEKQGAWPLIEHHLRRVLANDDERFYEKILEWFAHVVQKPHLPPGLCLAFLGAPGSGKSTVGRILEKLIGPQHYLPVSQSSQVVGRFNGHLEDRIVLFSDEAFWAGDVQGMAALKTLISEPTLTLESKFGRVERVRNCVHLIMATNSRRVAPVEFGDRRFVASNVSSEYAGNRPYFEALYREIDGDGLAAFMYDMRRIPVPDRLEKPRDSFVAASAANEQARQMFDSFFIFLDDRLMSGVLLRSSSDSDWPAEVEKNTLYHEYLRDAKDLGNKYPLSEGQFSRRLTEALGHVSEEVPGFRSYRPRTGGARRPRVWIVPPLDVCRQRFGALVGTAGIYDFYGDADKTDDVPVAH